MNNLKPGCEGATDGIARDEIEYVVFAQIDLPTVLPQIEKLAVRSELQEQYEFLFDLGSFRVRKSSTHDDIVLTGKTWTPGVPGKTEVNGVVAPAMFDVFKRVSTSGLIKRRLSIPIPDTAGSWPADHDNYYTDGSLFWEVDVVMKLVDGEQQPVEWLKIDLEIPTANGDYALSKYTLPFATLSVMDKQAGERTPEEASWVKTLYREIYNCKYVAPQSTDSDVEDGEVSAGVEGFFDPLINLGRSITSWWDAWQRERIQSRPMPDSESRAPTEPLRKILKEVRKTYGNKTWMANREFVEGDIDLTGLTRHLYLGSQDLDPTMFNLYESAVELRKLSRSVLSAAIQLKDDQNRIWSRVQKLSVMDARREIKTQYRILSTPLRVLMLFNKNLPLPNKQILTVVGNELITQPHPGINIPVVATLPALGESNIHDAVTYMLDMLEAALDTIDTAVNIRRLDWVISRNYYGNYHYQVLQKWGYINDLVKKPNADVESAIKLAETLGINPATLNENFWVTLINEFSRTEIDELLVLFNNQAVLDSIVDGIGRAVLAYKQAGIVIERYAHRSIVK